LEAVIMADDWIVVGEITAPHGLKGEVRVLPTTDFPERLAAMRRCTLRGHDGAVSVYDVLAARPHKGFYVLRFAGIDSRDAAEGLRGTQLVVTQAEVMKLPEGCYYPFQLEGLAVYTTEGLEVGHLREVLPGVGNDVFVVRRPGNMPDALIPAVRRFVREIDLEGRRMIIDPIPGMLDDGESR
jgi:16S rRNA processing protein RimM